VLKPFGFRISHTTHTLSGLGGPLEQEPVPVNS